MPIASGLLVSTSRYLLIVIPFLSFLRRKFITQSGYVFLRAIFFTLQTNRFRRLGKLLLDCLACWLYKLFNPIV
jgi:hypothetical protein